MNIDYNGIKPTGGKTTLNKNIIVSVINLATKEIAGVSSLCANFGSIIRKWFSNNFSDGVKVSYLDNKVNVDVYVNVNYGYNVSEIAYKVQENIKNSLASMVDVEVGKINVHVLGVDFIKEQED